jgi:uncharacterized protein HemX
MKTKLILLLVVIALAITAAAIHVAKQQHSASQEKHEAELARQRAAEEYHNARKKTGEFLVPDTGSDILGNIKKQPKGPATPPPATTPTP